MSTTQPPVPEVAASAWPDLAHRAWRARGVHRSAGWWVVARPEDVDQALVSSALLVAPHPPAPGPAGRLQVSMARFSDGDDHRRRRADVEQVLDPLSSTEALAALGREACRRTAAALPAPEEPRRVDAVPLGRTVPVAALAAALGVADRDVAEVVRHTGSLCDALAPLLPGVSRPDDAAAAEGLLAALRRTGWADEHRAVAVAGVLFQARDATAALIGSALLAADTAADPDVVVDRVLREQAPVQATRRRASEGIRLAGLPVPAGAQVWVALAAAEQGPAAAPATFGSGPHRCPGAGLAVVLARSVVRAVRRAGWRAVPGQAVAYEPRPNLRVPASVLLEREPS